MGAERETTLEIAGKRVKGRALLETDEIIFSPTDKSKRILIRRADLIEITADGALLRLRTKKDRFAFDLGAAHAAKWEAKIKNPPALMDKLGVKDGVTVRVVGDAANADSHFESDLKKAGANVSAKDAALTFFFIASKADLKKLAPFAKNAFSKKTAIWIVYPKGKPDPREADVIGAGRDAGLKDIKVARFSETHTALKFVGARLALDRL